MVLESVKKRIGQTAAGPYEMEMSKHNEKQAILPKKVSSWMRNYSFFYDSLNV